MTLGDRDVRLEVMRRLVLSAETRERLRTMPRTKLALLLREHVLAEMPMDSAFADLIDACADRLAGDEGEPEPEALEAAPAVPADVPDTARLDEDGCCLVCGRDVYGCAACQKLPPAPLEEAVREAAELLKPLAEAIDEWGGFHGAHKVEVEARLLVSAHAARKYLLVALASRPAPSRAEEEAVREVGTHVSGPLNSTRFTDCCGLAVSRGAARCPGCMAALMFAAPRGTQSGGGRV